jgi:signal transduction histidine kinase
VALVALIPTGLLDRAALSGLLSWQLREDIPNTIAILESTNPQATTQVLERLQLDHCLSLGFVAPNPCINLSWENFSQEGKITSAVFGDSKRRVFRDFDTSRIRRWRDTDLLSLNDFPDTKALAILPSPSPGQFFVATSSGPASINDFLAAALDNLQTGQTLRWAPATWVFALTILSATLSILLLYAYPAALGIALVSLVSVSLVLGSLYLLDRTQIYFPFVPALLTQVAVVFVAFLEQLDRRERSEWKLGREREALLSLDEMRNNFLSLVTHDLKTPLARIHAQMEALISGDYGPVSVPQSQALHRIVSANGQLQRSITSLLLLSRIEARQFELKKEPTDLEQLLKSVVDQNRPIASDRDISIEIESEPLFLIELDPSVIRELLNNLIDNAIKYAPPSTSIKLRLGESENCPELSPPAPGVWIEVQDQGLGIAIEDRHRVLGRFIKGSNQNLAADQSVQGTGLGLYLCSFFAEQHGGHLSVHSRVPGESASTLSHPNLEESPSGTLVRVVLPL